MTALSPDELLERSQKLAKFRKNKLQQVAYLKNKIVKTLSAKSLDCDKQLDELCCKTVRDNLGSCDEESVQRLFLDEQLRANQGKVTGRRWHPTTIRWCLVLHAKSKSAYRYLSESGFIKLPTERTLSDYRNFRDLSTGVDKLHLFECSQQYGHQDVSILIDEIKIKDGLVYNTQNGKLFGYVDVADTEKIFANCIDDDSSVATHALVFMIRGLKSSLQAVAATYATRCLSAEQLYTRFWEAVSCCEMVGFRIRCCVSDGASVNRKFYKLHAKDYNDPITYRCINKYALHSRPLYFVSDTAHLMKTTRNCFENSGANRNSRRLVVSLLH